MKLFELEKDIKIAGQAIVQLYYLNRLVSISII